MYCIDFLLLIMYIILLLLFCINLFLGGTHNYLPNCFSGPQGHLSHAISKTTVVCKLNKCSFLFVIVTFVCLISPLSFCVRQLKDTAQPMMTTLPGEFHLLASEM